MKNFLCSEYQLDAEKISIIPNGLSDALPVPANDKDSLRRKWRMNTREPLLLFVGRLHPVKGLRFLISAFRKVLDTFPDCRLIIAGNGDYDTYLQEAKDICSKVSFTGLLEKKDLHELYQIADIGILPSLTENCSYVAIEMMMHGLPMITAAASGLTEMTEDGISGLQVPLIEHPDKVEIDTEVLAEKMMYLLQHPAETKEMGQNGRTRYLKKYSLDVFRSSMLNFYQSLFPDS